ncbi:dUTP diphosphatase [Chloroflexota bacterium]
MLQLGVKLVHPASKLPTRMTQGSAGLDLYAVESIEVPPARYNSDGYVDIGRALVPIGIILQLPPCTVGRIASRSGLSINFNIEVGAGWIDNDYRGELKVELKNLSSKPYKVDPGDRIAQLIILPLVNIEVKSVYSLDKSERDSSGFGSTNFKETL